MLGRLRRMVCAVRSLIEARRTEDKASVARYWSRHAAAPDAFSPLVYWLALPEVQRRVLAKAVGALSYASWPAWCVGEFLKGRTPARRMLSVGCGTGSLERELAGLSAFLECDAIDLAPGAIAAAREKALGAGIRGIRYRVADIETLPDLGPAYDAVWFNSSLHHIRELEAVCGRVAGWLRPDGLLFVNEYVGPSRFAFGRRQRQAMEAAFDLIPRRYRRSFLSGRPDEWQETVRIPNPREVAAADPSEAVRSGEIMAVLQRSFRTEVERPLGGTLLQFVLSGIAGNFRADDPGSIAVLEMLFAIEDALMETGDIGSDFALIVARTR